MKRRLLNLLTVLSLLLCVAVVALWARSYFVSDRGSAIAGASCLSVTSFRGEIGFSHVNAGSLARHFGPGWRSKPASSFDPSQEKLSRQCQWRLLGAGLARHTFLAGDPPTPLTNRVIVLPYWLLAVMACVPTAAGGVRLLRARHRRRLRMCPRCGYDLRATPGRCPECGRTAAGPNG